MDALLEEFRATCAALRRSVHGLLLLKRMLEVRPQSAAELDYELTPLLPRLCRLLTLAPRQIMSLSTLPVSWCPLFSLRPRGKSRLSLSFSLFFSFTCCCCCCF